MSRRDHSALKEGLRIEKLILINFRNYRNQEIDFDGPLHILQGANAQGKTNLLEGIYYCARGRSFKNVSERDLIRFGQKEGYLFAKIEKEDVEKTVEVKFSTAEKKRIRINEVEIENLEELHAQFDVVLFAPEDLEIVKEGPRERRKFLDHLIHSSHLYYRKLMQEYQRVLTQRNHLLKKGKREFLFEKQLSALDELLVQRAIPIYQIRKNYLLFLDRAARKAHREMTGGKERLELKYLSNLKSDSAEEYAEALKRSRERDVEYGNTDLGIHKDDILILVDGKSARDFASQGQQRTIILSLRLAEKQLYQIRNQSSPIVLLDDVFSELDENRAQALLKSVEDCQTIITTNFIDKNYFTNKRARLWEVREGTVFPVNHRKKEGKE